MATLEWMRWGRCLACAGLLFLPACSTFESDEQPASYLPPPRLTHKPIIVQTHIIPVSGQTEADETERHNAPTKGAAVLPAVPAAATQGKPLPIDLPTALTLSGANPLDIQIASERLRAASASLDRAKVMWLPNIGVGVDYFRHDGQIQDVAGRVFTTSKSSFLFGAGPTAVFPVSEAMYAPLAARQVVRARQADIQATRNDATLSVAEAYFTVQQARGEVAGAIDVLRRAEELVKLTEKVSPDFAPTVEVNRAKTEVARRRLAVESAFEGWQVASAELTRILRLEPGTLVEPAEEPALEIKLIDPTVTPDELIPLALTHRPELASDQVLIQAALVRLRQEKARPFVPTVALRGVGSQVPGLAGGVFGGGINDNLSNFAGRFSFDLQAVWEIQNLGLGNRAMIREREAERRQALLHLLRTQDRVAAEVVQAHTQLRRATNRLTAAEDGVTNAVETVEKSLRGLVPGKRGPGGGVVLIVRPQEAVAAVSALGQAYRDYYVAVADHNRAQFRLYRALGHPAHDLTAMPAVSPVASPTTQAPVVQPPQHPSPAENLPIQANVDNPDWRTAHPPQSTKPVPVSVYSAEQSRHAPATGKSAPSVPAMPAERARFVAPLTPSRR